MKKYNEKEEQKRRDFIRQMEYEIHKRGITKRKEDYEKQRARKYVRDLNEMYSVIDPTKHIEITEGTKKEGIKHCNTKSQWKYNREELEKLGKVKPEIQEIKENKEEKIIDIPPRKEKIMLILNERVYIQTVFLERKNKIYYAKLNKGGEKYELELEKVFPSKEEKFNTIYGEMNGEMLLNIALKTKIDIYRGEIM